MYDDDKRVEEGLREGWTPDELRVILDGPDGEEIKLNVKRGAAWLEERHAGWAHLIVAAVEKNEFDLECYGRCAVGTVLGSYVNWFGHVHHDPDKDQEAVELGFMVDPRMDDRKRPEVWAATEQAWVDIAQDRL